VRLLVTGAAGFIGSHYARTLLLTGLDGVEVSGLTVLDKLTYAGVRANLAAVEDDPRFRFVLGDICDADLLAELLPGHDAVVHFAAESHVDRSIVAPDAFVRTNCDGTNVMCDVARRVGVERFVHISTSEVYGTAETALMNEEHFDGKTTE